MSTTYSDRKPRAYAVLAGGGVKGAALAGAVAAARKHFDIDGYGGTSAGSVVALLASIGVDDDTLQKEVVDTEFTSFLDDGGHQLRELKQSWSEFGRLTELAIKEWSSIRWVKFWTVRRLPSLISHVRGLHALYESARGSLWTPLGLYDGRCLKDYVLKIIQSHVPALKEHQDITFQHLTDQGAKLLKIVAADSTGQQPVLFALEDDRYGTSVVDAVRASASYPIVFRPHDRNNKKLVDGGLASNLPAFLFRRESLKTGFPTLAFDLINPDRDEDLPLEDRDLGSYVQDLIATALDSSDVLLRSAVESVIYIPIVLPRRISAVDFDLPRSDHISLFNQGYRVVDAFLTRYLSKTEQDQTKTQLNEIASLTSHLKSLEGRLAQSGQDAQLKEELRRTRVKVLRLNLMKQYGDRKLFEAVLRSLVLDVEDVTNAENVRASIMLPTGIADDHDRPTMIIVYHFGFEAMDNSGGEDSDLAIELALGCGANGRVWEDGLAKLADLQQAPAQDYWNMGSDQHALIPADRKSLVSYPIRRVSPVVSPEGSSGAVNSAVVVPETAVIGTLSVDSTTPLADTFWEPAKNNGELDQLMSTWAEVISRILP